MSDIDLTAAIEVGLAAGAKINPRLYAEGDVSAVVSQAAVVAAAPLIEAAVREQIAREERDEPPSLTLWADGATTDQREVIYGAAVDAAFDASEGMDGVSVGAVGSLSDCRGEQP